MARPLIRIVQGDVLETLRRVHRSRVPVAAVLLDPPYNVGAGGVREDYLPWLLRVIRAAARVGDHVFVWGFPATMAAVLMRVPTSLRLKAWLTWAYTNAPTRAGGWRPAQQTCLHLARRGARMHPENFLTADQLRLFEAGKLGYRPSPPSVITRGLLVGWAGKGEQTGHPAQKPEKVIEPLILMSTVPGDLVIDPMAGSGTTGAVCARLGRAAVLGDHDEDHVRRMEERLRITRDRSATSSKRRLVGQVPTEARRREGVRLVRRGASLSEVARQLGVSRESVRRWAEAAKAGESLAAKPRRGGVPRLDGASRARVLRAGRAGKLGRTLAEIAASIENIAGIRYSRGHIPRLLVALGIRHER